MKLLRTLPVLALLALPAAAQQAMVDSAAIQPAVAPIEKVKIDSPKPKADRRIFWTGVSLLAASTTADAITTRHELDAGGWESNPLFGKHPGPTHQAALTAVFFAGQVTLFHYTERSHRWYVRWGGRAYMGMLIANHASLAFQNAQLNGQPNGKRTHPIFPISW